MNNSERTGLDLFITSVGAVLKLACLIMLWTVMALAVIPWVILSIKD